MGALGKNDLFRNFSVKLLFKFFMKTGLSANQITMLNFWIFELGAIALFSLRLDIWGLVVGGFAAMVDYIDGTVARARNQTGKFGMYLDTSSDWLYLMMLIGAISYAHNILLLGYITLIAMTFGNWVEYNNLKGINVKIPLWLGICPILIITILLGHAEYGITAIMFIQTIRTALLYWRSCGTL
jgi:phosphatidylglycerophosphate synthase